MSSERRPSAAHDPALAARLDRLAARRAAIAPASTAPVPGSARAAGALGGKPAERPRRRHPAKGSRVAALALSLGLTGALSYAFSAQGGASTANVVISGAAGADPTPGQAPVSTSATAATTPTASSTRPSTTAPGGATPGGGSSGGATSGATSGGAGSNANANANGVVVDGGTVSTKFGPVQVEATFGANGALTSVRTLQTPNDAGKSVRINNQAVPLLNQEALSAQSANVHTVSGATYTSHAYQRSLQSAIDAARAKALTTLQ